MEQDLKQLDNIFNAESSADKIGSSTITQLEEKINLYKIALDNATRESEEFYRVQTKLVNTQKALNEAIKNRDYTTESEDKATEKENAKKLQAAEALAKKKKEGTITPEELKEQDKLRKEYIKLFREGFKSQLKTIKVVDEKGNDITPLKLKQEKLKN